MLFNCFQCGKTISSKFDVCVYCKRDMASFTAELKQTQQSQKLSELKERYTGTFLALLEKTKLVKKV